jgi:hypothetical protein
VRAIPVPFCETGASGSQNAARAQVLADLLDEALCHPGGLVFGQPDALEHRAAGRQGRVKQLGREVDGARPVARGGIDVEGGRQSGKGASALS